MQKTIIAKTKAGRTFDVIIKPFDRELSGYEIENNNYYYCEIDGCYVGLVDKNSKVEINKKHFSHLNITVPPGFEKFKKVCICVNQDEANNAIAELKNHILKQRKINLAQEIEALKNENKLMTLTLMHTSFESFVSINASKALSELLQDDLKYAHSKQLLHYKIDEWDRMFCQVLFNDLLKIIERAKEIRKEVKEKHEAKLTALKEQAKKDNKNVLYYTYSDDCNDDNESCDIDTISVYVTPDGELTEERSHNW